MTQPDPKAIADELSEVQRQAMLTAFDIGFTYLTKFESGRSAKALHRRGLTHLEWAPSAASCRNKPHDHPPIRDPGYHPRRYGAVYYGSMDAAECSVWV